MRIRITYKVLAGLRFTSTLDIQKIWERSFRRSPFQIAYSSGFHPQPKIQVALPLPLGVLSSTEVVDIWLVRKYPIDGIYSSIKKCLPDGIEVVSVEEILDSNKSFTSQIGFVDYRIKVNDSLINKQDLEDQVARIISSSQVIRERRGKTYNLRELIDTLSIVEDDLGNVEIFVKLFSSPGKTGRPDEVALELGIPLTDCLIERIFIYTKTYGSNTRVQ